MFKNFTSDIKNAFANRPYRKAVIAIILFIIINALKISLFNYFLIPQATKDIFIYKFLYTLLFSVIIYTVVLNFKSRFIFLIVFIIQCVYMFTNISYYIYYHSYLHFLQWISLFREALISATHLANPKSIQLLVVFIDVPLAFYIFIKYFKKDVKKIKIPMLKYIVLISSLVILLIVETNNYVSDKSLFQYVDDRYTGETKIVERYGPFVNDIVNIIKNSSETKLISQITYGAKQSDKGTITGSNKSAAITSKNPNYVIIQVESMDANIVKQEHNGEFVMPFLSSLRENSVYYPYALSYHKGGGTSDAEFSVIDSVESLDSFPALKLTAYNYPNSMISKLDKASYSTMAFHGNVGTFYNRNIALSKMGFNKFYDISSMNYKDEGWGAPDDKVFSFAYDKISQSKQPFLSYIITMTSHGPFESARNYYNNKRYDDIENVLVKNYFNSFSYVDKCIEDFVSEIQAKYSNTYIIIYGDHTPNISTKEFNQASYIDGDKYFEFVPLFIITPDHKKHFEDKTVASFLDIAPTVLKTSKIPYTLYSDGINLLDENKVLKNIPFRGGFYDRKVLYNKISTNKYNDKEPLWKKYLPSFISSSLIERHTN